MAHVNSKNLMVACKICVDNKRKWKKMTKLSLKQHCMTMNSSHNKSHRKILHPNIKHLAASQLSLGYHYYYIKNGKAIYAPPSTAHCPKCLKMTKQTKVYKWSNCQHQYCFECACFLVNSSLSNNQIPRCCYPECNNVLRVKDTYHFKSAISKVYKYQTTSIIDYKKANHIFYGYFRNILTKFNIYIPNEIIELMCDYYDLYFFSTTDCKECLSTGHTTFTQKCHLCNGTGKMRINCKKCKSKGIIKYVAGKCRHCNGSELICGKCNATGKRFQTSVCWSCSGRGKTYKLCLFCDENNTENICEICSKCDGDKYCVGLDVNKICRKQLLCGKCNVYFPLYFIINWPGCCHAFCFNCFEDCVRPTVDFYGYSFCLKCAKFLTVDGMVLVHEKYALKQHKNLCDLKDKFITVQNKIAQMIAMGYKESDARITLPFAKGNLDLAANMVALLHDIQ